MTCSISDTNVSIYIALELQCEDQIRQSSLLPATYLCYTAMGCQMVCLLRWCVAIQVAIQVAETPH